LMYFSSVHKPATRYPMRTAPKAVPLTLLLAAGVTGIVLVRLVAKDGATAGARAESSPTGTSTFTHFAANERYFPNAPIEVAGANVPSAAARADTHVDTDPVAIGPPVKDFSASASAAVRVSREVRELEKSGPASGSLTAAGLKTLENWKTIQDLASRGDWDDFRCYRDGCVATVTSPDFGSAEAIGSAVIHAPSFKDWDGPTFKSGGITKESGRVQTVFILFRNKSQSPQEKP
jgi:hypothetical protein